MSNVSEFSFDAGESSASTNKQALDQHAQCLRHDLRQSLGVVMCLASVVASQPLEGPAVRDSLDQMLHEVDWLNRMVATGGAQSRASVVEAGDVVAAVWATDALSGRCSLRLVREACAWVTVDPVGLERSVRNLLDNAIRAAGDGDVEIRVVTDREHVTIEVSDSGPGFGLVKPQEKLGLLTVRRFAAEHNGALRIDRSHLGGALMQLVLPRADVGRLPTQRRTSA